MRFFVVFGLFALNGCGLSEEQFSEQMVETSCAKMFECFPEVMALSNYETEADCEADMTDDASTQVSDDCDDYNPGLARDCVQQYQAATCDDLVNGVGFDACDQICGDSSSTEASSSDEESAS